MSKLNFAFKAYQFSTDGEWLSYRSIYGKAFRVQMSDITGVSLDGGLGKQRLQINGSGTVLATVELPRTWAEKAQVFILKETNL